MKPSLTHRYFMQKIGSLSSDGLNESHTKLNDLESFFSKKVARLDVFDDQEKRANSFEKKLEASKPVFIKIITESEVPTDYVGEAERLVNNLLDENESLTILWLINMAGEYINKPHFIIQILKIMGNVRQFSPKNRDALDLSVMAFFNHNNFEISELSVRYFENKGGKESLKFLKSMRKTGISWFDQYIEKVIEDLSDKDC